MTQAIALPRIQRNCSDAMRFYETTLKGKLELLMSGADSPMAAQIPKEFAQRILHARLALRGDGMLYGMLIDRFGTPWIVNGVPIPV